MCHFLCSCAADRLCNSNSKIEEEEKVASKPPASCSIEFAVPSHNKFVWPGIDAIIEAYATHIEGGDCC